jgi:hypothetical protein
MRAASIIRAIALMMEAARASETSVDIQLRTRQYIPEGSELQRTISSLSSKNQPMFVMQSSGTQPGVREDTLRFSFLSFKTYYLIHYFGCNLFYLF